jgi:hypothetical protein
LKILCLAILVLFAQGCLGKLGSKPDPQANSPQPAKTTTSWFQAKPDPVPAMVVMERGRIENGPASNEPQASPHTAAPDAPTKSGARIDPPAVPAQTAMAKEKTPAKEPATPPTSIYTFPETKNRPHRTHAHPLSILNAADQSVMILIDPADLPQEWTAGADVKPARARSSQSAFYMDRNEITVEQYKKFDPKYDETPFTGHKPCPQCPAMNIDWNSADKYCAQTGKRLPSLAEWELAAHGGTRFFWPWGDTFLADHANILGGDDGFPGVAPVGSFPRGASRFGVQDMIGNVWEWVSTPHNAPSGLADPDPARRQSGRIVKGGGWTSPPDAARIDFENVVDAGIKNPTFGFRCSKPVL